VNLASQVFKKIGGKILFYFTVLGLN
jgi:hypothetical protein